MFKGRSQRAFVETFSLPENRRGKLPQEILFAEKIFDHFNLKFPLKLRRTS